MKNRINGIFSLACLLIVSVCVQAETVTLTAAKDNFGRSNERNRNSGANGTLYLAHAPNLRAIVAFDLSGVTNRILGAAFRFQPAETNPNAITLTVAPMVYTAQNAAWVEGLGAKGTSGQNSRPGESCYGWCAFPDSAWEYEEGRTVTDLGDARLWTAPAAVAKKLSWTEGDWIEIPISDLALLEKSRAASPAMLTLGLWGTSGNGLYSLHAKESVQAPELVLEVEGQL